MIQGVHTMFYSSQPDQMRAFLRDVLGLSYTDVGDGWLIFDVPEAEMGCHPADQNGTSSGTPHISFYCEDIEKTMSAMQAKGVEFTAPVEDHGYGLVTHFKMPGDFTVQLYQPKYAKIRRQPVSELPLYVEQPPAAARPKKRKSKPKKKAAARVKTKSKMKMKSKKVKVKAKKRRR
jgi:catechol 2,3-dioxygenase-like lactoylglutathione lyase family enzyme